MTPMGSYGYLWVPMGYMEGAISDHGDDVDRYDDVDDGDDDDGGGVDDDGGDVDVRANDGDVDGDDVVGSRKFERRAAQPSPTHNPRPRTKAGCCAAEPTPATSACQQRHSSPMPPPPSSLAPSLLPSAAKACEMPTRELPSHRRAWSWPRSRPGP